MFNVYFKPGNKKTTRLFGGGLLLFLVIIIAIYNFHLR